MKDSLLRIFSRILWMILQEGVVGGTLGGGEQNHSHAVDETEEGYSGGWVISSPLGEL